MKNNFDEWLKAQPGVYPTVWEIALARKAWDAAMKSIDEKKKCTCWRCLGLPEDPYEQDSI